MVQSDLSFLNPAVQACPFAAYRALRERGTVYVEPETGYYVVFDHALIRKIAADAANFANSTEVMRNKTREEVVQIYRDSGILPVEGLVTGDGPDHAFQRALVEKVFTASRVAKMENYLSQLVDECIDAFIDKGRADFVTDLAIKLPMSVIADQLGVPRADLARLKRWGDAIVEGVNPRIEPDRELELTHLEVEFNQYLLEKAEQYRVHPADCLMSDLVHAEVDGRRLTQGELVNVCAILLVGGNESTTNALTNAMGQIMANEGLEEELRANPQLIPQFVEESLRYEAPIQALYRRAVVDVEIDGIQVPAGSIVVLRWGAGNRDPKVFQAPDAFDFDRRNARLHETFGHGKHFCVGSQLARGELRITFERLLSRVRNLRLADGDESVTRLSSYVNYGVLRMIITFDKIDREAGVV